MNRLSIKSPCFYSETKAYFFQIKTKTKFSFPSGFLLKYLLFKGLFVKTFGFVEFFCDFFLHVQKMSLILWRNMTILFHRGL